MATRQLSLLPLKSGVNIGDLQEEAVHWGDPILFQRKGFGFLCGVSAAADKSLRLWNKAMDSPLSSTPYLILEGFSPQFP